MAEPAAALVWRLALAQGMSAASKSEPSCSGISKACVSSPKGVIHTMELQGEKIGWGYADHRVDDAVLPEVSPGPPQLFCTWPLRVTIYYPSSLGNRFLCRCERTHSGMS